MRNTIIFIFGMLCALWFAWIGMIWVYWGALLYAYPAGLIALVCWLFIRKENKKRTKFIPIVLFTGLILSLTMLLFIVLSN